LRKRKTFIGRLKELKEVNPIKALF